MEQPQHQPEKKGDVTSVQQTGGLEVTSVNNEAGAANDQEIKEEEIPQIVGISADSHKEPEKQIELQSKAANLERKRDIMFNLVTLGLS